MTFAGAGYFIHISFQSYHLLASFFLSEEAPLSYVSATLMMSPGTEPSEIKVSITPPPPHTHT